MATYDRWVPRTERLSYDRIINRGYVVACRTKGCENPPFSTRQPLCLRCWRESHDRDTD